MATNSIKLLTGNSHPELAKLVADRLGIELTKIMVLQYSNQETSVTIGESVRDEDGKLCFSFTSVDVGLMADRSLRPPIHRSWRYQRWPHGTSHHHQRLQDRIRPSCHCRDP